MGQITGGILWQGPALAFALGAFVSGLELLTSKYQNTSQFLLKTSRSLYFYGAFYGILAGVGDLALDSGVLGDVMRAPNGQLVTSPWLHAVAAGLATRAFMQLNLFTLAIDSTTSTPVGLQTLAHIFERPLLRSVVLDEFAGVRSFVEPYASVYQVVDSVKSTIKKNTPPSLQGPERKAFDAAVDAATSALEAMELFLRFVGIKTFRRAFPLKDS